jgi:hypothetical protein
MVLLLSSISMNKKYMKKVAKLAGILALSSVLLISTPVISQDANNSTTDTRRAENHNNNNWGWIGLIGLAGLLGLRKKDNRSVAYDARHTSNKSASAANV